MQSNIHFNKEENYFLINGIIKVANEHIEKLFNKRNLEDLIKLDDNLYYYKSKPLIEILFETDNYKQIKFKNNDYNDYRLNNIEIIYNEKIIVKDPENITILSREKPKIVIGGAYHGQEKNHYWKVKDNDNNIYYMIHVNNNVYTKISIEDKDKVLNFNGTRPVWHLHTTGYITTTVPYKDGYLTLYLHQLIMDSHLEDNKNMKKTVDHINRDKLDNRRENLRFATMNEQNLNKGKQKRQKNACLLPDGIKQSDLPIHVCYNKRCYNKENNSWREFFTIEKNHPKLDKTWESSKSNNVSITEKLEQTKLKLKYLNGKINEEPKPEFKLFKGLRLTIDKKYNKYKFEYDNRTPTINYNYKMILTHNDLQLMIDKFIDLLNDKYKDNKMEYYKLDKPVMLDFSNVNNEIIEDQFNDETETETETNTPEEKFTKKPDLPDNFSLFTEKDVWYLSYNKTIDTIRYNKKIKLQCMCIQTELDRLINEINNQHPNLKIKKYTVKNTYDFTDKNPLKENIRPDMPSNFCIANINSIDHIQFTKKINDKNVSYKTVIKSYDLQNELNIFVDNLNEKYKLNISPQKIIDDKNWKTTNKIKETTLDLEI
jgi:hypothetical protein